MNNYRYKMQLEEKKQTQLDDGWEDYVVNSYKQGRFEAEDGTSAIMALLEKFKHLGNITYLEVERYE